MVELEFNPQVGDKVEVQGYNELFEILEKQACSDGQTYLKLRGLTDGRMLDHVHQHLFVDYPNDERVRRELKKILTRCKFLPEDFLEDEFEVKRDPMYDGTPRIMVYFHLKPGIVPSDAKTRVWSDFYDQISEKLQSLMDSDTWLQFAAKEDRSALSAAI